LKILIACIAIPGNRFVLDLKQGLEVHGNVFWEADAFWKCEDQFDVVHIHWPEYLSYELEAYLSNNKSIDSHLWKGLKQCLEHWSKHSKIILTRHNDLPHSRKDKQIQDLYKLIYKNTSIVTHFANYSIQQFKEWYPDLDHIKHVVIPHHNYASLPNDSTKQEARDHLNIDSEAEVMLVFGSIKENEKSIIKIAFDAISNKNKVLLAPGWKTPRRKISYIRLREWVWNFEVWIAKRNKQVRTNLGFIKEENAHYYLNAADFLFIPRTSELNSGNITLGCTFGLVVVGADTADIGEVLKETGNPTFTVGNSKSVVNAIKKAFELTLLNHGQTNKNNALNNWDIKTISKQYHDQIQNLLTG
jgi:hypothetical protein